MIMFEVTYDNTLKNYKSPVYKVNGYAAGFTFKKQAEWCAFGLQRENSNQVNVICGFCRQINGNYLATWKNSKGRLSDKTIYGEGNSFYIKNGKNVYTFTPEEVEWFKYTKRMFDR
jgi:hypothetical protein